MTSQVTLRLIQPPTVPLEAENVTPDRFMDLSHEEICSLRLYHGKRRCRVDDFFDVEGERSDSIVLHGDLGKVRMLGRDMSRGTLIIHGDAGMHLGSHMRGGEITVHGDVGDWLGAEMRNGLIRIHGNAGGQIGAAYRGSLSGMRNGLILVDGSAGLEVGMRMKRGTISIKGPARDFTGLQMKGGTIILHSGAEIRTGAWMIRGTIISLQSLPVLPTFNHACDYNPEFIRILDRMLAPHGIRLPSGKSSGHYARYSGDSAVPGKGELLIWTPVA